LRERHVAWNLLPAVPAEPAIDLSPHVSDRVASTTCYMCACRCGIDVHLRDGADGRPKIRYIEGNRSHPKNKGVLCAKGSAGIMQHYSPGRLRAPLKRVGPRGRGEFEEISWEEALSLAVSWLEPIRATDPRKLAFFTGRDQSQSLTGWWAQQFGTPNYAAHGGFCSVNMAAAGIYTIGGAFWEFGETDWDRCRYFMLFGVAEDHDSNPLKLGLSTLRRRGAKIVSVNPVRTGYGAIADEWVGITPGTDGLFILSLVHLLLKAGKVDLDSLLRYSNAAWLVIRDEGAADHGLFARDGEGRPLAIERGTGALAPAEALRTRAALSGEAELPDGRRAVPVFRLLAERYLDPAYAPERIEERTGVPAATIRRIAAELARAAFEESVVIEQPWMDVWGERHEKMVGRPVSFHAMRGVSAHSNGFQTARALHLLQVLLGSIDAPGGHRYRPPYPKPLEAHPRPCGEHHANAPLPGPHLGFPRGPEDLLLEAEGAAARIDKAFTWEAPLAVHGLMHMVISNAVAGEPYPIDTLFLYMANMAWNSSMNTAGVMKMLEAKGEDGEYCIPRIIYCDAYASETVAYADLVLPDTTYLERHDACSLLDRPVSEPDAAADSIRWPVVEPDREVRGFQSVLIDLGARLKLPGFVGADGAPRYRDYADYLVRHERRPGVGPLAGWRGEDGDGQGRGPPNPGQLRRYIENGGFWTGHVPPGARFFKHANAAYQDWAVGMGFFDKPQPVTFQLWLEPLARFQQAAEGHGEHVPPVHLRDTIRAAFEPLPVWYPPFEEAALAARGNAFPYHAITQRPMAMYHAWHSQNPWLRQIHGRNPLYVPGPVCDAEGLETGDWVWLVSHHGRIKAPVVRMEAVNGKTLWTWNAIGKRAGAWALSPDAPEATKGFLLNHLIHELLPPKGDGLRWANVDPVTGQAAWYDLKVRIEKAEAGEAVTEPRIAPQRLPAGLPPPPGQVRYGADWTDDGGRPRREPA